MGIRRYTRAPVLGGMQYGTSLAINVIKQAVDANIIRTRVYTLQGSERLDTIAGREYGDASNWWIIAAASGIGWGLQVPAGTRIVIPVDLNEINDLVG